MKYLKQDTYLLNDSYSNSLLLVNIDRLLVRLKNDSPEYFVNPDTNNPSSVNRIKNAIGFTKKNLFKKHYFEPPMFGVEMNKIGVIDGRHRIAAAKKMGYTHLYIEVPRDQKNIFNCLI